MESETRSSDILQGIDAPFASVRLTIVKFFYVEAQLWWQKENTYETAGLCWILWMTIYRITIANVTGASVVLVGMRKFSVFLLMIIAGSEENEETVVHFMCHYPADIYEIKAEAMAKEGVL